MIRKYAYWCFGLSLPVILALACSENFSDNPKANQAPQTFTSIFTENDINAGRSRKVINWWGDDPDGIVIGFIFTFNENSPSLSSFDTTKSDPNWTFTTETQRTFSLTLTGTDTIYTFWVKAVDDNGATDPDGAITRFPIVNSQPIVEFLQATDVPETTFTVATFAWGSTDLDGDDTIAAFQYVLDDTLDESSWRDIDPKQRTLTLTATDGLTEGEHVFFLRSLDIAGARSDIIRMPRNEDDIWYVREPQSTFLIIDDYNFVDGSDVFYQSTLQGIVGPVDVWDIKKNNRALEPPSNLAFTMTLQLYDRIFWYGDPDPNLGKAEVSIPEFLTAGGKIIMSTRFKEFASNDDTPLDFSPADTLGGKIGRILRNQILQPSGTFAASGFPELKVSSTFISNVFPVVPKNSSETIFELPENAGSWPGRPSMGVINGASTFVFFAVPLAQLNGSGTVSELFDKILNEVF